MGTSSSSSVLFVVEELVLLVDFVQFQLLLDDK